FFQFAGEDAWEANRARLQDVGGSWHIALKVSRETFDEIAGRVTAAGVPQRIIDHGYCESMYLKTPDGLRLEFTVDAPDADEIAAMRRADAHAELKRWLAGDRRINNSDRPYCNTVHFVILMAATKSIRAVGSGVRGLSG
ncbi:VOC family protein, partial [Longimicrobium sp.]|uniref:VOC family protein n=1 Tax=Longimicrobium sp. TaxID=2029185 RepID=UPI002EDB306D